MAIWRAQLWAIANSALVPVQSASGTGETIDSTGGLFGLLG
jgi:hypothetical protein